MNPFDRIKEYRSALLLQIKDTMVKTKDTLTYEEHYKVLLTFLKMLEQDLESAEYNYIVEKANSDNDTDYGEQDGLTFQSYHLNENLLLFQPLFTEEGEVGQANMDSLIQVLEALKEHDKIQEDILIIPPGVNVLRATLVNPHKEKEDTHKPASVDEQTESYHEREYKSFDYDNHEIIGGDY